MRTARISTWQVSLLMLLTCVPAWPQRYNFKFYGEEEGLRNLGVQVVIQDRAGFLWAGTQNGLFRYDGARFMEFSTKDGLPGTRIESLHESPDGTLWVGTSLGLARKLKGGEFETVQDGLTRRLAGRQGIATSAKGQLYLATERGLVQGDRSPDGASQFHVVPTSGRPGAPAVSVFVDRSSVVWFGCGTGLCTMENGKARDVSEQQGLPQERWFTILGNEQGDMWVRSERSLYRRRAGSAHFEALPKLPESSTTIPAATLDFDGNLLVTTDRGLARQAGSGWELINVADDINSDDISAVLADHEGFIWLGLSGSGLARWLGYGEWQSWTRQDGLSRSSVWSIAKDRRDGRIWVGTRSGLSFAGSDGKWRSHPIAGVEWVRSVATMRNGSLWIGADTAGLVHLRSGGGANRYQFGIVPHVLVDRSERVWASTSRGLFRSTPGGADFERLVLPDADPNESFEFASEDAAGQIWVSGSNGLVRYSGDSARRFTIADGLKANAVAHTAHAADGSVWIGYREAFGLTHLIFRGDQMRVEHVTTADQSGLHSDKSLFLAFDRTGRLWAGTDHGVDVFDQTRWRHFGRADGLIWDDCNSQAVFTDDDGMWIGTSRGLSRYQPRKTSIPPIAPNVVLTAVRFGNQPWTSNAEMIPFGRRDLYVQFAALTFAQDSGITFQVRLDGNVQERRGTELNFASLDPGPHNLEVMARNSRGMWSVEPAKISFTIATPWYLSWWFRSGSVLLILIGARLIWLHRTHRLRAERHRLEKAVAERTQELSLEKARAEFETTVVQGQKVEIERLLVEAQQASKLKSEFLANMSHELRTPMNGVMGMTDLVLATHLEPEQREYLQSARGAADSLLRLVNDILDFSKIEAGKLDLNVIEFSLRECLEDTRKMFALPIDAKGLVYIASVAREVPNRLVGDPDRLRQILINLVGNAVKFTDKGSIAVRIERETQGTDWTLLRFEVCDTGIGIPVDKCSVIFESFRQADGSMTRKYGGTGLGLSISAKLAELMGGKISVESEVGKGSKFRFTARFGLSVERVESAAAPEAPRAPEAPSAHPAVLLRVLLAEDNLVNQRVATRLIEKRGHQVTVAGTGREALAKLEQGSFHIILMDVQMPDMDGLEATMRLRELERPLNHHMPVVALTAHTMKGDREKCIEAGMDAYITKPVNAQELISVLESTAAAFSRVAR